MKKIKRLLTILCLVSIISILLIGCGKKVEMVRVSTSEEVLELFNKYNTENNIEEMVKLYSDEYIDYIVPQIYWSSENNLADYEILVEWWSDTVKNSEVDLYIGQGIHSEEVAKEIDYQINFNKQFDNIAGSVFYSYGDMINNLNIIDKINYCFNN